MDKTRTYLKERDEEVGDPQSSRNKKILQKLGELRVKKD